LPFNGSGVYIPPASPGAFNPAISGQNATPAAWNTLLADISMALSTTITKDGQTTISQDIPFAGHKITDLGDATSLTDALNRQGAWYKYAEQDLVAQSLVDFTDIPAEVNNLQCVFEALPTANGSTFRLQTYGADGVLDTGGSDYSDAGLLMSSGAVASFGITGANVRLIGTELISTSIPVGITGQLTAANIQAATYTKFMGVTAFWSGSTFNTCSVMGVRNEADRITGFRVSVSAGVFTGKFTLFASA